jgi:hypothetical protein
MPRRVVEFLFLLFITTMAWGQDGAVVPGCQPAYLTMHPDGSAVDTWQFEVKILEAKTRLPRYTADHVHASRACCEWSRRLVTEAVNKLYDKTANVTIGDCR